MLFQCNNYKNSSNNNFLTVLLTGALPWVKVNGILSNKVFHKPALFQKFASTNMSITRFMIICKESLEEKNYIEIASRHLLDQGVFSYASSSTLYSCWLVGDSVVVSN